MRRTAEAADATQREVAESWERALAASGLPVAMTDADRPRPRISFGAPLPTGIAAESELIDVVLTERLPAWHVREALTAGLPAGWSIVDLYDVWLAGPALAGRVVAADYRIELAVAPESTVAELDPGVVAVATTALLDASTLPGTRTKGSGTVGYDLRPLLVDVAVADPGPPITIRARTRFHAELGTGRPEAVVAALGGVLGCTLEAQTIVRERVLLAEEVEAAGEPISRR